MQKVTKKKPTVTGSTFKAPTNSGSMRVTATSTKREIPVTSRTPVSRGYLDQDLASRSSGKMRVTPIRTVRKKSRGGGR